MDNLICVSIIIPIYNTGEIVNQCIDSIITQTYCNWELIIVDDGSDEETREICNSLENLDNRIQVFHEAKQGVSAARNFGIKHARGKWIYFVDGDDYVDSKALEIFIQTISKTRMELLICGYNIAIKNNKIISNLAPDIIMCNKSEINKKMVYLWDSGLMYNVWNKLFLREIIVSNNLRFPEGKNFNEDRDFVRGYLKYINSIVVIHNCLYFYSKENELSAVGKYRSDKLEIRKTEYHALKRFFAEMNLKTKESEEYIAREHFDRVVGTSEELFHYRNIPVSIKYKEIKRILTDQDTKEAMLTSRPKSTKMKIIKNVYMTNCTIFVFILTWFIYIVRTRFPGFFYKLRQRR